MAARELIVLGTASMVPTRHRNHNGYFLRWDDEGLLFDPGEGTQRQFTLAGVSPTAITRICLTHLHGDHCLGLPGIVQRLSIDDVRHTVELYYPADGEEYVERLLHASIFEQRAEIRRVPVVADGVIASTPGFDLVARHLDHRTTTIGYQLVEHDRVRMLPERLDEYGVRGPDIGRLQRDGTVEIGGRTIVLDDVSTARPGRRFAFVMDTRACEAAVVLADRADLLVCEATYLHADLRLAVDYGHMTARQCGEIAHAARARRLVLTHFSQRYPDTAAHVAEASTEHGDVVAAADLMRIELPERR